MRAERLIAVLMLLKKHDRLTATAIAAGEALHARHVAVRGTVPRETGAPVAGSAYRGVGIPAVIGTGRAAAARLLAERTMEA